MSNDRSALSCGCDPWCKPKPYYCEQHRLNEKIAGLVLKLYARGDEFAAKELEQLLREN